ncbi:toll-like receptor 2 type-2 [Candoia aspera]|uniref:toll-like receptor 2 type-2 n=1 Tax=Candoia aspera TaxID=51853 RepID=UPI002FD7B57D
MGFFIRTLHFYLIVLFCGGDGRFQHSDNKILSKSSLSPSSLPESQIPRRIFIFLHNVRKEITTKKKASLNILNVFNMQHNSSFQVDPTNVLSNSQPQHMSPQKFSQTDGIINVLLTDPPLRATTLPPMPAEKQQGAEDLLNPNSVLKWNVLGNEQHDEKGTRFPSSVLQITASCGILANGTFQNTMKKHIFLDFSNNLMDKLSYLTKSLHHFDLSNCNLQGMASPNLFPNLTVFKIQNNEIEEISPAYLPDSLEECDVSKNKIRRFPFHGAEQSLKLLNLSRNLIMQLNLNSSYLSLTNLDVSHNLITNLLDHMGKFLPELKYLNLSENKIFFLQSGSLPKSLVELDISNNAIAIIMKEMFHHLTNLKILTIQGKHFFCNCELYWFVNTYLASSELQINGRESLFCGFPQKKRGLLVENSHLTMLYCSLGLQIGITAGVAILIMTIISVLCWHFDGPWYVKMGWYWCKAKRKQHEKRPEHKMYDAFISYSENDASWTKEILLEKLEANGFKICYHERDFMPGHPVLGNIFYCIENSHKVLFVLSPSFVHSCWCQYELYFAEHRVLSENQDSLIMVVLEDLPPNSIPQKFSKLRKLLKRKTYLKWSPEEHKQKLFWHQLTAVLKTMNEPVLTTQRKSCTRKQMKLKEEQC